MRTRSLNHSIYEIQYHIVWGTKYRKKYLKEYVKEEFLSSCFDVCREYPTLYIHAINIDQDHTHIQIEIPPDMSIATVVQKLKIESSKRLKKKFKFIRDMYIDGSIWSVGYYVSSVGVNEESIKRYIAWQGKKDFAKTMRLGF